MRRPNSSQKPNSTQNFNQTLKSSGVFENNEQERLKKSQMEKARSDVRKKQEELHLKQLEFKIIEAMDMKEINTMLLERNAVVFQQIKEIFDEGQVKEPEIKVDLNQVDVRKPRIENYGKRYVEQAKNIYKKPNPTEIKELVEQFNQNTRLQGSKQVDSFQRLHMEYYKIYSTFLQSQPSVEQNRRQLIQELGEVHELLSVLNNAPSFEKPAIWNKQQVPEEDKMIVDEIVNKNIRQIQNKYDFSIHDFENEGVLEEVKDYIQNKYFKGIDHTK
ncbi:unnamed protein product [Paramecium primaurelia]|uniref:Uncharacterized protein n=1 Tax=Paramecium primaurelia TaxID=5886 RepID=A0A8S1LNY7_PARPR|nr:unnamed protein product [Paramecium primaurelia]